MSKIQRMSTKMKTISVFLPTQHFIDTGDMQDMYASTLER